MELVGNAGSLTEGGLQYNSDDSIQPYLRQYIPGRGSRYITMNNNGVHYTCGQNLAVMHGATSDGSMTYTEVGQVPSNLNPSTDWVDYGVFTLNNASWYFNPSPGDLNGGGIDYAGAATPCLNCSISQVTSLAQGNSSVSYDGSYFGVDPAGAQIHWMQVAFGEWESDCQQGTNMKVFTIYLVLYGGALYIQR